MTDSAMLASSSLPPSTSVSVDVLSRVFSDTRNSYKYLFFLGLLEVLKNRLSSGTLNAAFSLTRIGAEMLTIAWYPHKYFRLHFGTQDQISAVLLEYPITLEIPDKVNSLARKKLREHFLKARAAEPLLRYVPHRFIRPFFSTELRGKPDGQVDSSIQELSRTHFDSRKPFYYIAANRENLVMHVEWLAYFKDHHPILVEWVKWHWLCYMQRRNPNTPNLAAKLVAPPRRASLQRQRDFWNKAFSFWQHGAPPLCPYTGSRLGVSEYDLDHFLPWSFVAHDRLWNLVPAHKEANLSKSDALPDKTYIDPVASLHVTALTILQRAVVERKIPEDGFRSYVEDYLVDLRFESVEDVLRAEHFRQVYRSQVMPLIEMAQSHGFRSGWMIERESHES